MPRFLELKGKMKHITNNYRHRCVAFPTQTAIFSKQSLGFTISRCYPALVSNQNRKILTLTDWTYLKSFDGDSHQKQGYAADFVFFI